MVESKGIVTFTVGVAQPYGYLREVHRVERVTLAEFILPKLDGEVAVIEGYSCQYGAVVCFLMAKDIIMCEIYYV